MYESPAINLRAITTGNEPLPNRLGFAYTTSCLQIVKPLPRLRARAGGHLTVCNAVIMSNPAEQFGIASAALSLAYGTAETIRRLWKVISLIRYTLIHV